MLLVLIHRVDVLCRRADVVGGMIPATPKMISPVLILTFAWTLKAMTDSLGAAEYVACLLYTSPSPRDCS